MSLLAKTSWNTSRWAAARQARSLPVAWRLSVALVAVGLTAHLWPMILPLSLLAGLAFLWVGLSKQASSFTTGPVFRTADVRAANFAAILLAAMGFALAATLFVPAESPEDRTVFVTLVLGGLVVGLWMMLLIVRDWWRPGYFFATLMTIAAAASVVIGLGWADIRVFIPTGLPGRVIRLGIVFMFSLLFEATSRPGGNTSLLRRYRPFRIGATLLLCVSLALMLDYPMIAKPGINLQPMLIFNLSLLTVIIIGVILSARHDVSVDGRWLRGYRRNGWSECGLAPLPTFQAVTLFPAAITVGAAAWGAWAFILSVAVVSSSVYHVAHLLASRAAQLPAPPSRNAANLPSLSADDLAELARNRNQAARDLHAQLHTFD